MTLATTERLHPTPVSAPNGTTLRLRKEPPAKAGALEDPATSSPGLEAAARAYQEFCQRHGRAPARELLEQWHREFGGDPHHARLFRDLHQADPVAAERLAQALTALPVAGCEYQGFRLVRELGRGAFGRVFLARQGELAGRPVVLKIAADLLGEVHALAQLQHPNVVPIYSVHLLSPFQAVCMPYLGATTLEDVLSGLQCRATPPATGQDLVALVRQTQHDRTESGVRLDPPGNLIQAPHHPTAGRGSQTPGTVSRLPSVFRRLSRISYVDAVLWLGARLADGLSHAHERGIIHRDLKPANVLLTDEGQPVLLDFSVAEDTKLHTTAAAAWVGGTLPYMSPEHLAAFRGSDGVPDARSDVYALGVMLFELLTRHYPFRVLQGPSGTVLEAALEDRNQPLPRLRPLNPAISPAVESIVRHCLEPDPRRRYQTAAQLREDLERQLLHRPLRHAPDPSPRERLGKWLHRHPSLTSLSTLTATLAALLAAFLVLILLGRHGQAQSVRAEEARRNLERFQEERRMAQFVLYTHATDPKSLDIARKLILRALGRYGLPADAQWLERPLVQDLAEPSQQRLPQDVGELLLLLARVQSKRAEGQENGGIPEGLRDALSFNQLAERWDPGLREAPTLWLQRAELHSRLGNPDEAARLRAHAASLPPVTARDLCWMASDAVLQGRMEEAVALLQAATGREPRNFWAWFVLGTSYDRLDQPARAEACYSTCIALEPGFHGTYFSRGLTYLKQRNYRQACEDFDQVLRQRPDLAEARIHRAQARLGLGQWRGAVEDLAAVSAAP